MVDGKLTSSTVHPHSAETPADGEELHGVTPTPEPLLEDAKGGGVARSTTVEVATPDVM